MKRDLLTKTLSLLLMGCTVLGLTACSKDENDDAPHLMYGPPQKAYNAVE